MSDGGDCQCSARCESDCVCGADWTPEEVCELQDEVARLKAMIPRWIPVSERLPEAWYEVIVHYDSEPDEDGPPVDTAYIDTRGNWRHHGDRLYPYKVLHWMPLPEPPTDVAEQT